MKLVTQKKNKNTNKNTNTNRNRNTNKTKNKKTKKNIKTTTKKTKNKKNDNQNNSKNSENSYIGLEDIEKNDKDEKDEKDERDEKEKEKEKMDDEDIEKLVHQLDIEENIYDPKKIQQYKDYLSEVRQNAFKSLNAGKYQNSLTDLNKEILKTSDHYLKNELLRIAEDIKYQYHNHNKSINNNTGLNYPDLYDPYFSEKIYRKAEFYKNKLPKIHPKDASKIVKERELGEISLAQHQRFLKNFMSSNTPYNSLLIFHGLGVGKTCAAIAIAETLKSSVMENNQKITIIHKPNFEKNEIFDIDKLAKGQNQCAGDTYLSEFKNKDIIKKCQDGNQDACKIIKTKIDKVIKNIYNFYGALEWAKHVLRDLHKVTRGVPDNKKADVENARIKKMYSNSVIIIDEAHNIKDPGDSKTKFVPPVLMKVLENADNIKLILLTGTPMFNEPSDLISIMNYLLANDKRPILKESDVFKQDGSFSKNGTEILQNYTRGYVSFMRSEDPIKFPIRLSPSINSGTNNILNLHKYPTKNIYGKHLLSDERIKHLEIISCPMNNYQEKIYRHFLEKRILPDEEKTSAAYSSELQILNFIYQGLDKTDNPAETYGEKGLNSVMSKISVGNKQQYKFNDPDYALNLKGDSLKMFSSKMHTIMDNIEKARGLVFVYTEYIVSGILPMAFALELAGYRKYKSSDTPLLVSEHKDKKYKGDYLIISGGSKDYESFLAKRENMVNDSVKVILGSRTASEGFNLFGIREIHILNPWHNLNRLSQAIGRGLRTWSHLGLPKEDRNITVYLYAATFKGNEQETIDLKIYREAESKAIHIGEAETILRKNAIDCHLNKDSNQYLEDEWGEKVTIKTSRGETKQISFNDKPYSQICHFQKDCDFKCFNPPNKYDLKNNELDYSTYNFNSMKYETDELIKEIVKLYKKDVILNLQQILHKLPHKYSKDNKLVYKTLEEMIHNKSTVLDKFNRPGYIIYRGNYYIYQPNSINNEELTVYQRQVPPPIRPNMIDLSEYVIKLTDEKKKLSNKEQYNITDIMEYISTIYNNIKNKLINDIFQTSINLNDDEIYQIITDRLSVSFKKVLLHHILLKIIKNEKLDTIEQFLYQSLELNIIRKGYIERNRDQTIVGFRLVENDNQTFYKYNSNNNSFSLDQGFQNQILDIQNVIYNKSNKFDSYKLYGYLKFDKIDQPPQFKIRDLSKGDKKSIKGISCVYKSRPEIYQHLKELDNKSKEVTNKKVMCDDIEVILRRNDKSNKLGKRWFYTVEESKELEKLEENK
jgi:hypothetical protein